MQPGSALQMGHGCDSGSGLDIAHRVLAPFSTTRSEGMGIRLSVCREIVEAHEGKICCAPNANGGAVFRFTPPIVVACAATFAPARLN
jgi:signal transduction histidine kinase